MINIDLSAIGIQVQHLIDGIAQKLHIVGDDEHSAGEGLDPITKPHDRVVVEVVCRLIEQEGIRPGKQDSGQLHATPLPARES